MAALALHRDGARLEDAHGVFVEQPPQQGLGIGGQQLGLVQRLHQMVDVHPIVVAATLGEALQHEADEALRRRTQADAGRELLGLAVIDLQRLGERHAGDLDQRLVALAAVARLDQAGQRAAAHQGLEVARSTRLELGHATQLQVLVDLRDQQLQRRLDGAADLALELQVELGVLPQIGGQQRRRGERVAEQAQHVRRVRAPAEQVGNALGDLDRETADAAVLDQKRQQTIRHQPASFSLRMRFSASGLALPCVAFIAWPTKKPNSLSLPPR